jgi:Tfp pilus assembly protein PilN
MLRTNLSTRPFYNERAVHAVLALAAILVVALTVFNASRVVSLSRRQTELSARAQTAETRSRELRAAALDIRRGLDTKELEAVATAAREANAIIDRRLFSWTELFNRFETTMPDDVRITSIRPKIDMDGTVRVTLGVVGRRVEDIEQFMGNLEATGTFADVLMREENVMEDRTLVAVLDGRYLPAGVAKALQGGR